MRRGVIYQLEVPHREAMQIRGFEFGDERGEHACAIVGSTRGNEVQQTFVCASLVESLSNLEREGAIAPRKSVLVIPCVNPYSMNIHERFWPSDGTDINRRFPGNPHGETTERIAAAVMRVVRLYAYGIQLCSFNQPGDFQPHVRVTHQGPISDESLELAPDFGLPFVVRRDPSPFDTGTLNYAWQQCGTHAFSLYSRATDRLDMRSARSVIDAVLRFLEVRGIVRLPSDEVVAQGALSSQLDEANLVDVRTTRASGFLIPMVQAGDRVTKGMPIAQVKDTLDAGTLETLRSPTNGRVFFMRTNPLVQQHMVVVRIAPD